MKKLFLFIFVTVLYLSCETKVVATDIPKINGYWEIEKVVFPDGSEKEYSINEVYDYFEINNNKGIRKKVMPQLDGTFLVNDTFETIQIIQLEGKYTIHFSTAFAKWREEIVLLDAKKLVLLNPSKNEYHYKRTAAINIIPHGKKTQ